MAYIHSAFCAKCGKVTQRINHFCTECHGREEAKALAAWAAQSIDAKLIDLHKRLLELEKGPIRY